MNMHAKRSISTLLVMGAAAAGLLSPPALSQDSSRHKQVIVRSLGDNDDAHSIGVTIEDGEISVVLDGKEVPSDRIKREDGRIIILDEDGKEIEELGVFLDRGVARWSGVGHGLHGFALGGAPQGQLVHDEVDHPPVMLGLTMAPAGPALAYHLDLEEGEGTMISGVYEDLPAHAAGLRQFDVIVEIDGKGPSDPASIRKALDDLEDGDHVELTVISRGKRKTVDVKVVAYDSEAMHEAKYLGSGEGGAGGFRLWTTAPGEGGGDFKDFFIAPDQDWFRYIPNMEEIHERIQDAMRKYHSEQDAQREGHLDGRLDELKDRMSELERMLDRLLDQADKKKKEREKD